jgi:hypothetical protein
MSGERLTISQVMDQARAFHRGRVAAPSADRVRPRRRGSLGAEPTGNRAGRHRHITPAQGGWATRAGVTLRSGAKVQKTFCRGQVNTGSLTALYSIKPRGVEPSSVPLVGTW